MFTVLDERKTKEKLRAEFPTDRNPYANDYDYEDNSDLEEDNEEDILYDELAGALQVATEKPEDNANFQSGNIVAGVTGRHHQPPDFGLWYRAVTCKPRRPLSGEKAPTPLKPGRVKVLIGSASVTGFSKATEAFESFTQ